MTPNVTVNAVPGAELGKLPASVSESPFCEADSVPPTVAVAVPSKVLLDAVGLVMVSVALPTELEGIATSCSVAPELVQATTPE